MNFTMRKLLCLIVAGLTQPQIPRLHHRIHSPRVHHGNSLNPLLWTALLSTSGRTAGDMWIAFGASQTTHAVKLENTATAIGTDRNLIG